MLATPSAWSAADSTSSTNLLKATGLLVWCQKRKFLPAAELTSPPVQNLAPVSALPRWPNHSRTKSLSAWSSSSSRCPPSVSSQCDCANSKLSFSGWTE